ncbi:hypothetical protein SAMN05428981_11444 [Bacillus sp. OV194]|nr:hypothetical protein SAMN05428981_11444 [Bacillus sp. OV194]
MTANGFFLKKLVLTGNSGTISEIKFEKGLNVIFGPTNTGKSFLFECINYMLGGKDTPDEIEEIVNYDTIFLEIESKNNNTYTFERKLSGGSFKKYNCSFDVINSDSKFEILSQQHSKKQDSISKFLLSLSGYKNQDLFVRKNQKNKLQRFTYRSYNDWILIDEIKIITKVSPVHSDDNKTKTAEEAAFKLILTNKDDSDKAENFIDNNRDNLYKAQIEIIDKLIGELELNISNSEPSLSQDDLKNNIQRLTLQRSGISSEIQQLSESRKKLWEEIQQNESQILTTKELLKRFILLQDQYETDRQRISFLLEGEHYFSLLNYEKCPECNQVIPTNENPSCTHFDLGQKKESYKVELQKILYHLEDLSNTIEQMNAEIESLNLTLTNQKEDYQLLSGILDIQLEPQNYLLAEEIESLLRTQKEIDDVQQRKHTLSKILDEKKRLLTMMQSETQEDANLIKQADYISYYTNLCEHIKHYLVGWRYPGAEKIDFDVKQKDIVISGKPRRLFGKGFRSISYSAFVLGIMRYCIAKEIPHPGLVVLDSPITSYKEEDSEEEKTSDDLQERFFEFLSEVDQDNQVIILENKKPSKKVIDSINFIEFTKSNNRGRYGFITKNN